MKFPNNPSKPYKASKEFLWVTCVILVLASVFRLVALQDVPPGLAQDEVLNADIVTFIRQGQHALFFREGYGHEPLYHYWSVPFQLLFGDNVLSIRLPAVYLGLLLIAITLRWVRRDFGNLTAVITGLGLATSWWPIIFSRIGLRPIMEPVFLVLMVWFWPRRPWLSGIFLGLSFYTYTAARVVFLIPILFIFYQFLSLRLHRRAGRMPQFQRVNFQPIFITLAVALLIYLPLGLYLRSDPSLQQRLEQLEGPFEALRNGEFRPVLETTLATLGVFSFTGDPRWTYTMPERPLFDWLMAPLFYLGLLLTLTRLKKPHSSFILIWLFVSLLPSALTPQAPSTVRLVGGMPVVYLMPGIAIMWLWEKIRGRKSVKNTNRGVVIGFGLFVSIVLGLNINRTIRDGFVRWPEALETRLKYQSVLQDIGRHWKRDQAGPLVVATSFYEPIGADSLRRDLGFNPNARWVQTGDGVAGAIVFPNQGRGRFYVPEFATPVLDLMEKSAILSEPIYRSPNNPSFALFSLPPAPIIPANNTTITFDGVITLLGYNIDPIQSRRPIQLFSYWRVESDLPADLAIFVHLVTMENDIITQHDGLDTAPTTLQPGDIFIQRHLLPYPGYVFDTAYTLQLGLYTRTNLRRLSHLGEPADRVILIDRLFLTEIE